jgi:methyltransferase (TIGR00027 family)
MAEVTSPGRTLASTAYWTAAVRARETARADRLFDDPWAGALAGREGMAWLERRSPESVVPMVLRTRFFDDFLLRVVTDEGVRQIVLMAAGLDTRAFRLRWPERTLLFEVDQPSLFEDKERTLRAAAAVPTCSRHVVAVDLTADWETALAAAGFDRERPAAWLLEGFLFYLPTAGLAALLDRVTSLAAPGSHVGFDVINSITLTSELTRGWVEMQAISGAPWIGTMDDPEGFLAARSWRARAIPLGAPEAAYGRWPYPAVPRTVPGMPHLWFVVGEKQRPARS